MDKIKYIAKPKWKWLWVLPSGFLTSYNLYRQEINLNAPPFISFLDKVSWSIWLLLSLLLIAIIVIDGLIRYNKKSISYDFEKPPILKSSAGDSGQSLAAGRDINLHQTIIKQEKSKKEVKKKTDKIPSRNVSAEITTAKIQKCSHCGYSYHVNNSFGITSTAIGATTTCPKCGNVDKFPQSIFGI